MNMVNPVVFLVSSVGMNLVLHIHNLAWIFLLCLYHSPTLVLYKCTIYLLSMWLLCTYLSLLLSGVGYDILPNILPQNHRLPK